MSDYIRAAALANFPDVVRRHGLDAVLGRVDGLRDLVGGGPKAPYLAAHLTALRVPPGEVVMIADTLDDAEAARAVGAAIVLYDGGITDTARLEATGAPVASSLVEAVAMAAELVPASRDAGPEEAAVRR